MIFPRKKRVTAEGHNFFLGNISLYFLSTKNEKGRLICGCLAIRFILFFLKIKIVKINFFQTAMLIKIIQMMQCPSQLAVSLPSIRSLPVTNHKQHQVASGKRALAYPRVVVVRDFLLTSQLFCGGLVAYHIYQIYAHP